MTFLKDFSVFWSLLHTLIIFLLLSESRYSKNKYFTITLSTMIPLILVNFSMFLLMGMQRYMPLMLLTLTLPSFIFFLIMAKHRDGRFIFTFCMVDTLVLEVIYITLLLDSHIPGEWVLFFTRLLIYPVAELLIYKKFRRSYIEIQNSSKKGWLVFALIGLLFYAAITISMIYPTVITERPEYMPSFILLLVLMPICYISIFQTLKHQMEALRANEQENILKVQVSNIIERIEEYSSANEKFRRERHDMRHKLQTISSMVEKEQYDELRGVIAKYTQNLDETKLKKYCENAVLDAVLSSYIRKAESQDIKVTTSLVFPEDIPVSDAELATVFANALENAINACLKLPSEERYIDIKVILKPKFMLRIENSFVGNVSFNEDGIPVTQEHDHGIGTRSIVAFCKKYGSFYDFSAEENKFVLRIDF